MLFAILELVDAVDSVLMLSDVCGDRADGPCIRTACNSSFVSSFTWTRTPGRSGHLGGLFGASESTSSGLTASCFSGVVARVVEEAAGTPVVIPGVNRIVFGAGDNMADTGWCC